MHIHAQERERERERERENTIRIRIYNQLGLDYDLAMHVRRGIDHLQVLSVEHAFCYITTHDPTCFLGLSTS